MFRYSNTINEEQEALRAKLQQILRSGIDKLEEDLQTMDAGQRTKVLLQLAEYVLPKIERTDNREAYKHTIHTEDTEDTLPKKRRRAEAA